MPNVALVKGMVRYDGVFKSLKLIQRDVSGRIGKSRRIMLKPDLLHVHGCSPSTNLDSAKAVLDFVEQFTNKKVTVAEGSFSHEDVFLDHGFHQLLQDYSVKFLNLDNDDFTPVKVGSREFRVSRVVLASDFRVSLASLGGDSVLSIPNIVMASIHPSERASFFKSRFFHRALHELSKLLYPHVSVIDGFGKSVYVASASPSSADRSAAKLLKASPRYLSYFPDARVRLLS